MVLETEGIVVAIGRLEEVLLFGVLGSGCVVELRELECVAGLLLQKHLLRTGSKEKPRRSK